MKALRLCIYLTALSVSLASIASSSALEETEGDSSTKAKDCELVTKQMLQAIKITPNEVGNIFEQSISKSKDCVCELLTAAIQAGDGGEASVKRLVVIALKHAGDQASAIAECAVIAAPTQLEAIREAFAEVPPKPVIKKTSRGKPKIGTMIKNLVPGLKSEPKLKLEPVVSPTPKKDSSSELEVETPSKVTFRHRPSGKEVLSDDKQVSGDKTGIIRGKINPLNQFEFDYLWPEMEEGGEDKQTTGSVQWHTYVESGIDSNVNTAPGDAGEDSYFVGGGFGTYYALISGGTRFDIRARFGARYDEKASPDFQDVIYQGRLLANLEHQISERLEVSDQFGLAYDAEPDFLSGETTGFRTDQYVFAYNHLAFGYRWAKHFETRTYYTVSTIQYKDELLKVQENRWRHLIGQQFRFLLNDQQAAFLEYRYGQTDFQSAANDSQSHYFIGGVDYTISPDMKGSVAAGAERRSFERYADQWQPYANASIQAQWLDRTYLRMGARLGFEDAEIGAFQDRYSFRTGLAVGQELSDRMTASLGFFYLHSDFDAAGQGVKAYADDALMLQLNLNYALRENMNLYLGYDFTTYNSGDPLRNYDRHRVRLGLNSSF